MKMSDVAYLQDKIELLFKFPIIKSNLAFIKEDFEKAYVNALSQDQPEEIPETHLQTLKSDLFTAFAHGVRIATSKDSSFIQNFKLPPPEIIVPKSKIITLDDEIKTPQKLDLI